MSQSESETIEQVFERCKRRTNGGKAAGREKYVICETNHGIKFRIFWDDSDEEIRERYHVEMTHADRMLTTLPNALGTDVPLIIEKAQKYGLCLLEVAQTGIVVQVSANDTPEEVVARLNEEYARRVEAGDIKPPSPPDPPRGIPTSADQDIKWADLHPALRAVVLESIRKEISAANLAAARSTAQNLAIAAGFMNTVQSVEHTLGDVGGALMMEGMSQAIGGINNTDLAIGMAFEAALKELEKS